MLTFEKFNNYLTRIIDSEKWMDDLYELMGGGDEAMEKAGNSTAIQLLSEVMDDTDNEWILYWLYEMECGTKWGDDVVCYEDGAPIQCHTIRELYDFLVEAHNEKCARKD